MRAPQVQGFARRIGLRYERGDGRAVEGARHQQGSDNVPRHRLSTRRLVWSQRILLA